MKKYTLIFFAALMLSLPGWGQVVPPGVKVTSAGLSVDTVFILLQGKPVKVGAYPTGGKLSLSLNGIHGFALRNNKAFPGCSMKVVDNHGKDILSYDDLFKDYTDGVAPDDAAYLDVDLPIGAPMVENATYRWKVKVWDKSGKAELDIETPVTVSIVKDMLGIKKISTGLTCKNAFIMTTAALTSNQVKIGDELDFVLTGISGFLIQEDKVQIGASILVTDKTGDSILEYKDVFKSEDTYNPKEAETMHLSLKVGDPLKSGSTYLWTVKIWDKASLKGIEASCSLIVK